eukprot:6722556-Prymnesium_polylepis.1
MRACVALRRRERAASGASRQARRHDSLHGRRQRLLVCTGQCAHVLELRQQIHGCSPFSKSPVK